MSRSFLTESEVEAAALEWLEGLGYEVVHGPGIEPEGPEPERERFDQVILEYRFRDALARPTPEAPGEALDPQAEEPDLVIAATSSGLGGACRAASSATRLCR